MLNRCTSRYIRVLYGVTVSLLESVEQEHHLESADLRQTANPDPDS